MIKKFLFYALLIILAGIVLHISFPRVMNINVYYEQNKLRRF